jgi:hypothetical protein
MTISRSREIAPVDREIEEEVWEDIEEIEEFEEWEVEA